MHHDFSHTLAAEALLQAGRYTTVYALLRWLERSPSSIESNDELSTRLGISPDHCSRCIRLLEQLGFVDSVYATNGDKATRRLVVPRDLAPWSVRTLKGLVRGDVTLDFQRRLVVHKSGISIDCSKRTRAPYPPSVMDPSATAFEGEYKGGELKLSAAVDQAVAVVTTELSSEAESELPEVGSTKKRRASELDAFTTWPLHVQLQVSGLIDRWRERFNYPMANHTLKRRKAVRARLMDGYTVGQLELALDTAEKDPFWRGQNDRNTPYDQIERLFLNEERIDRFLAKARTPKGAHAMDRRRVDLAVSDRPLEESTF